MKIAIIDYGAGNTRSVQYAFDRIGVDTVLTSDKERIQSANGVLFPGVGHASNAMQDLEKNDLQKLIPELKMPVLGICLGMQLMCAKTEEGDQKGLGIVPENVVMFTDELKVPQTGWNQLFDISSDLFKGIKEGEYFYFVHSYYVPKIEDAVASSEYGIRFTSALKRGNFYGCQFHPEKSASAGERVLKNFVELCG